MTVRLLHGDCRNVLITLPDKSVHCCVTSPPYFGLRDYGHGGQIGLEASPAEYVEQMVAVFRAVRRVLRDDGTLWLNLGDSYCSTDKWGGGGNVGKNTVAPDGSVPSWAVRKKRQHYDGIKPKDLIGIPWRVAFALQQPWERVHIKDRADRAWLAALVDGEGCLTIMQAQNGEKSATSFPPVMQVKMTDPECIEYANAITGFEQCLRQDPPSLGGNRQTFQWRITSRRAADIAAEIYPFLRIKRKQAIVLWNHQLVRDSYETKRGQPMPAEAREKQIQCRALIQSLNRREPVDIPSWMVEPRISVEPGYYLRQDVIWSKPNPMPESVRDRCTKAHEYLFLLTKSERYYFDAEAIQESATGRDPGNKAQHKYAAAYEESESEEHRTKAGLQRVGARETRNKRSVWSIATQPFGESHFATMPPELAETCIKAGCPPSGVVLDPFGGAGTTGLVADRLQRDAIVIELNPEYVAMARGRIERDAPLFADVAADLGR